MAPVELEAHAIRMASALDRPNAVPDLYRSEPGDLQVAVIHHDQGPDHKGKIVVLVASTKPEDDHLVTASIDLDNPPEGLPDVLQKRTRKALASDELEVIPIHGQERVDLDDLDAPKTWSELGGSLADAFEILVMLNKRESLYHFGRVALVPLAEFEPVE